MKHYMTRFSSFCATLCRNMALMFCCWNALSSQVVRIGPAQVREPDQAQPPLSSLPFDRDTARWLEQARQALEARNWQAAIERAQKVLEQETDSFVPDADGKPLQASKEAEAILRRLPPEARQLYDAQYEPLARRMMEDAKAQRDLAALNRVVLQYPLTASAWDAANYLATALLDEGKLQSALRVLNALVESPEFRKRGSVATLCKLAAAQASMGSLQDAERTVQQVSQFFPGAALEIRGQRVSVSQYLDQLGQLRRASLAATAVYSAFPNSAGASDSSPASGPFLEPDWSLSLADPSKLDLRLWDQGLAQRKKQEERLIPAVQPVAHNGRIFVKALGGLIAIDAATGNVRWRVPAAPDTYCAYVNRTFVADLGGQDEEGTEPMPLQGYRSAQDHVYDNSIELVLGHDRERVYSVDLLAPAQSSTANPRMRVVFWPGGMQMEAIPPVNRLSAYDQESGTLLWKNDGAASGTFFLGAPLALNDELLILADQGGEVSLWAFDPATGAKRGQIVLCEAVRPSDNMPYRRREACPITVADGVAYCMTQFGRVFAVDLVSRRMLWNFEYPNTLVNANPHSRWQPYQTPNDQGRPCVSAPSVAEGRLVVLPSDTAHVFCLDRATGKEIWRVAAPKSSYVAGVVPGKALLVGEKMQILSIEDGQLIRDVHLGLPVGRGLLLGNSYFQPVEGKRIVQVFLDKDGQTTVLRAPLPSEPQATELEKVALPDEWKFTITQLKGTDWTGRDYDDRSWRTLRLDERGWNGAGYRQYRGTAYYRLRTGPVKKPKEGRLFLVADRVDGTTVFYVNGKQVGMHFGTVSDAHFDITEQVDEGGPNTLCARVRKLSGPGGLCQAPGLSYRTALTGREEPGTLLLHQGKIISASALGIGSYPMIEALLAQVQSQVEQQGPSAERLLLRGKIRLAQGQPETAMADIRSAWKLESSPRLLEAVRSALFQTLVDQTEKLGERSLPALEEMKSLARGAEERTLALERLARHYANSADRLKAIQTARELLDSAGEEPIRSPEDPNLWVRGDRWIGGKVADLWAAASPDEKGRLLAELEAERTRTWDSAPELAKLLRFYSQVPEAGMAWHRLAHLLASSGDWHSAEILWIGLLQSPDEKIVVEALAGLIELYHRLGLHQDKEYFGRMLTAKKVDYRLSNDKVMEDVVREFLSPAPAPAAGKPSSPVEILTVETAEAAWEYPFPPVMASGFALPYFHNACLEVAPQGGLRLSASGDAWSMEPANFTPFLPGNSVPFASRQGNMQAFVIGHQMFLNASGAVLALSPLSRNVLWRWERDGDWQSGAGAPGQLRTSQIRVNPGGGFRVFQRRDSFVEYAEPMLVGVSPRAFLLLDGDDLVAVDPISRNVLWRRILDIPGNSEVQFSEEFMLVFDSANRNLKAFRLADGRLLGEKNLSVVSTQPGFFYLGRYFFLTRMAGKMELQAVEPWTGKMVWTLGTDVDAAFFRPSIGELGVIDSKRNVTIHALDTGDVTFQGRAEGFPIEAKFVSAWWEGGYLMLTVPLMNARPTNFDIARNFYNYQIMSPQHINGNIYCMDRQTGKLLWEREFTNYSVYVQSFPQTPLMTFWRGTAAKQQEGGVPIQGFDLLVIERSSGRMLLERSEQKLGGMLSVKDEEGQITVFGANGKMRIQCGPMAEKPPQIQNSR